MLNRNQHYSSQLYDLEQEKERDRDRERQQEEEMVRDRQDVAAQLRKKEVLEAQRRHEEDIRRTQNILDDAFPLMNSAGNVSSESKGHTGGFSWSDKQTTPRDNFFDAQPEREQIDLLQTREGSERASTLPFSPKASASFENTGGAAVTSSSSAHSTVTSGTKGQAVSVVSVETHELKRQETTEDVNDIEEDIVDDVSAAKDDDSDDGFNF